jgi:hypothetical protein
VIALQLSDGVTFVEATTDCPSSDSTILTTQTCYIPIASLRAEPFGLDWGASIYGKVRAVNQVGTSEYSDVGNGAVILTAPDVPINFADVPSITTSSKIGLSWEEGASNGGTPVIDYRILYKKGTESYRVLVTGLA